MSGHYEKAHLGPLLIVVISLLTFQICISKAAAGSLAWDPVTAEGSYPLAGYRIHYGTGSGNYTDVEDVGDVNTYGLPNLNITSSDPYYFVVAAYTSIGEEGFFSNEVCFQPITTDEDTPVNITLAGSGTYDTVVDTGPSHGQLSSDIGPILTYTPDNDYNGPDSFTFAANDGEAHVFTGIVSINVTAVNDPPTVSGGGSSGCFIATAAFGSNMDRHVQILSEFRDNRLLTSPAGHRMVDLYYKFSPPAAYFLRQHPAARVVVRYSLMPLTGVAYLALYIHPVALLFGFILLVLTGVYCGRHFSQSRSNFSQP